jgi:ubiquinone/menaquinone biosynthesis C-methylase UbiE
MSTYVLMRVLESAPSRYDLGIRLLTFGGVERSYDRLASHVQPGQRVLDIGCGTGSLALRAARRGARVKGIDVNAEMLAIAARRARDAGFAEQVELVEMGVAELDGEEPASYDAVTSGLCFSELSDDELAFTLAQVMRVLRPGGLLLVADEAKAPGVTGRVLRGLVRAPLAAVTYLLTQQTTHPVADLPGTLARHGFELRSVRENRLRDFVEIVARRPAGGGG